MRVRLILNEGGVAPQTPARDRRRPVAFALSCLIHAGVLTTLVALDPAGVPRHASPTVYDQLISPNEKKLVWYRPKELPRIDPVQKIGDAPTPQGAEKRNEVIISVAPDAKSARQLVLRDETKQAPVKETHAPNLVALAAPAQKEIARKALILPPVRAPEQRTAKIAAPQETAPAPKAPAGAALDAMVKPLPKMLKAFVPPPVPSAKAKPRNDLPDLATLQPETGPGLGSQVSGDSPLAKSVTKLPSRPFVAPSAGRAATGRASLAAPEPDAASGGAVGAAVLSTSPLNSLLAPLPEGFRKADLSAAPTVGPRSSGAGREGTQAPGLVLQPGQLPALALPSDLGSPVYVETRPSSLRATLSAPLRPSSRTIPRAIEARFRGRVVYTMIIPPPQLAMYASDWTVWFADRSDAGGGDTQMRAPLPIRKLGLTGERPDVKPTGRIQLSAIILKSGRVDSVELLDKRPSDPREGAVADFQHWQFSPAIHNGLPVDVDIIIEIPYQ